MLSHPPPPLISICFNELRDTADQLTLPSTGVGATGYDQNANKKQLISHFQAFSPPVLRLLEMTPDDGVRLWDLLNMELLHTLIQQRAVLIGDAAHPFLPRESDPGLLPQLPSPSPHLSFEGFHGPCINSRGSQSKMLT